jgi:phosphotransferase system  glucose/maltose/N-acetylglucosamine-specific IIC component
MKILIAGSHGMVGSGVTQHLRLRNVFLACGILSSLFYACMDAIAGIQWQNYSWVSQEFSRLSSINAPSRSVILALSPVYSMLVVAFGLGIWWSPSRKRALRVIAGALVAYALVSFVWPQFFPEDLSAPVSALQIRCTSFSQL